MKRLLLTLLAICLPSAVLGYSGAECDDEDCSEVVLADTAFKSIVLPFIDPTTTGIAVGVTDLFSRELLANIEDQAGAGVIRVIDSDRSIAGPQGEQDIHTYLSRDYHDAAERIAGIQKAQLAIWGALLEDGPEQLYLESLLTLRDSTTAEWNQFRFLWHESNRPDTDAFIDVPIGPARVNLPGIRITESGLVKHGLVVRCDSCQRGTDTRVEPSKTSRRIAEIPAGTRLNGHRIKNRFVEVSLPEEQFGWVYTLNLDLFPDTVWYDGRIDVRLRESPSGDTIDKVDLDGRFDVLEANRDYEKRIWYKIKVSDQIGWVGSAVPHIRSLRFPSLHFVSGLVRFGRNRPEASIRELDRFVDNTEPEHNVVLSVAHRYIGVSHLKMGTRYREQAMAHFDEATALTPFDPDLHTLRAAVAFADTDSVNEGFQHLNRALDLDPSNQIARQLAESIIDIKRPEGLDEAAFDAYRDLRLDLKKSLRRR